MEPNLLYLIGYAVFLLLFVRYHWRSYKKQSQPPNFTYSITDIWAAIVGLTPTLALTAYAIESSDNSNFSRMLTYAMFVGEGQLAGIFAGKLATLRPPERGERRVSNLRSGMEILLYAIIGAMLPIVYLITLSALVFCLYMLFVIVAFPFMLFGLADGFQFIFALLLLAVLAAFIIRARRGRGKV